jgi:hypothetical protein
MDTRVMTSKRLTIALMLSVLAFAGMSARAEIAGQVLLASDAVAVRAGKALPLKPGMMIEDKDTLRMEDRQSPVAIHRQQHPVPAGGQ